MSFSRRMAVAGLPAAGVTVFAGLVFTGGPAAAAFSVGDSESRPVTMTSPCADDDRSKCGYTDDTSTPGRGNGGYGSVGPTTTPPTTSPTTSPTTLPPATTPATVPPATSPAATPSDTSPATLPPGTTPTGDTDTVPPGSVSPTTYSSTTGGARPTSSSQGGAVSAGSLPVTGPPMGSIISIGGLLVAAGASSVWYTRRRRNA